MALNDDGWPCLSRKVDMHLGKERSTHFNVSTPISADMATPPCRCLPTLRKISIGSPSSQRKGAAVQEETEGLRSNTVQLEAMEVASINWHCSCQFDNKKTADAQPNNLLTHHRSEGTASHTEQARTATRMSGTIFDACCSASFQRTYFYLPYTISYGSGRDEFGVV